MLIEVYDDPNEDIKWIQANLTQYLAPGKKRLLILRWADDLVELHKRGEYKQELTTISGHIKSYLTSHDMKYAIPYIHEVLPFKFKEVTNIGKDSPLFYQYERMNEEILVRDSSVDKEARILLAQDCKKSNVSTINLTTELIIAFQAFRRSLETDTLYESEIPEKELEEYNMRVYGALQRFNQIRDGRHQVMPATQHMLFYALAVSTLNYTYSTYVRFIRDFERMTPKQSGKILRGHVTKMELLYEPKNRQVVMIP